MVNPPDADPVNAANTFVDTARPTSGPPSMPSTQSRTIANAGSVATTLPNPTRLATLITGSTDAFIPASAVSRNARSRSRFSNTTTTTAEASATITDQTPATSES